MLFQEFGDVNNGGSNFIVSASLIEPIFRLLFEKNIINI